MAYLCVTFLCWLFGGLFGLHHFYLGRDRHGFLWATTFGGFVIGWLREFTRLNAYTADANKDYPLKRKPSVFRDATRILGMFIIGIFYRSIFINAVPEGINGYLTATVVMAALGTTLAVHLIANIAHIKCKPVYTLAGAIVGEILFGETHLIYDRVNRMLVLLSTVIPTVMYWKERKRRTQRRFCFRFVIWGTLGLVFCLLWFSYFYHNAEIYVEDLDEDVKLREFVKMLIDSPEWKELMQELKKLMGMLLDSGSHGDYEKAWFILQEGVASTRIMSALDTLEFDRFSKVDEISESTLSKRFRELSRKWHPDKHPASEKDKAQEKFIEIQKAYETLKTVITRKPNRKTEL